ncbi:hypothetical protein FB451DRAFT_1551964 [Mycena latifolia]|nr:hypothetical protein FB451DRAFT_1551964 [Mycena latifolia]
MAHAMLIDEAFLPHELARVGACCSLFWLLVSGQSVFLFLATNAVYYLSKRSWVFVDVGDSPSVADRYPQLWVKLCAALGWTSLPRQERQRWFTHRFLARV